MKAWWLAAFLLPLSAQADNGWMPAPSIYSTRVNAVANGWAPGAFDGTSSQVEELRIVALETLGDDGYVGAAQHMIVNAPLGRIAGFLGSFPRYVGYYDGLKQARVLATKVEGDKTLTLVEFEQHIPIPFVADSRSTMLYTGWSPAPATRVIRYQLMSGNYLVANDGVIVLEQLSSDRTRYFELNLWNASLGMAKVLGRETLWLRSLRGLVQTNLAVKLMAENPAWPAPDVLATSRTMADDFPLERIYRERSDAQGWFALYGFWN